MSTAALELAVQLNDKASKGMDNIAKKGGGLGSVFSSILSPLGLLTVGIGALGGGLAMAAKAAAEEQVGVERLNVALNNSVGEYKNRTAEVNAAISAAEKMAFSDDAARDSLAMLVGVTKDVTAAQAAQAGAMDLARLKGISLEESTAILMGAFNGKTKALEKMGVSLKKGASDTEILAAVQKLAGGQAEGYANTTAGAMDRLKTSFGNALENIGAVILPKVTEALSGLADFVSSEGFQGALTFVADLVGNVLATAFQVIGDVIGTITPIIGSLVEYFRFVVQEGDTLNDFLSGIPEPFRGIVTVVGEVVAAFATFFSTLSGGGDFLAAVGELAGGLVQTIGDALPGIIQKLGEWAGAFIAWIGPLIPPFLLEVGKLLLALGEWIITVALPAIAEKLLEWGKAFIEWIAPRIGPFLVELGKILVAIGTWIITVALPAIAAKLKEWGAAFLSWVGTHVMPFIGTKLGQIWTAITNWIGTTANNIATEVGKWPAKFFTFITSVLALIPTKLLEIATAIWTWITDTAEDIVNKAMEIGGNLIEGIVEGLKDAGEQVVNFILHLMSDAIDAVKRFFGISSPSKVMAAIGENLGTSLMRSWGQSITDNVGQVTRALGGVPLAGGGVSSSSMGIPNGAGFSAIPTRGGGGGTGGGITIVVNAGIGADGRRIGSEAMEVLRHQLGLTERSVSHRGV